MTDDFTGFRDADILRLMRWRYSDFDMYTSELRRLQAEAQRTATERQRASDARNARRTLETIAPTLSAEDRAELCDVMLKTGCNPFEAAVEVGRRRLERGEQQ